MRKICTDEVRGVKMKKKCFAIRKNVFSLLLFLDCSFGFAFPRRFVELEEGVLIIFKITQNGEEL
jgi:hypothetical protein